MARVERVEAWREFERKKFVWAREVRWRGIPAWSLAQKVGEGRLIRCLAGVYRHSGDPWTQSDRLELVSLELPRAVVTMTTALHLQGIDTFEADLWLAFERDSHLPDLSDLPARAVTCRGSILNTGAVSGGTSPHQFKMHGIARALVECFRHPGLITFERSAVLLNAALEGFHILPDEIIEIADECRVGRRVRSVMASWSRDELVDSESDLDRLSVSMVPRRGRPPFRREPLNLPAQFALERGTLPPRLQRRFVKMPAAPRPEADRRRLRVPLRHRASKAGPDQT